jgi:adenine-specific DNA-methyltransferase
LLLQSLDQTRLEVSPTLDPKRRAKLGQFMTPGKIASFMAGMFAELPDKVRLLDAGAGMGALTAAFVSEALSRKQRPSAIDVTCYEVDERLALILQDVLATCADECASSGVEFSSKIISEDYILKSSEPLFQAQNTYNCAILNPPYGKINSASKWRHALRSLGVETVNLYSAFVAVALQQMDAEGELVAITPRSFCNGSYYKPFRRIVLETASISSLHLFESRRSSFRMRCLAGDIVFKLQKGGVQAEVALSTDAVDPRTVPFNEIVRSGDQHAFIRLPVSCSSLADRVQSLPCTLGDLGIKVSRVE